MTTLAAASSTAVWDQPGVLGFLVVFGMGVVLYFVFRSMTRHLRKVNNAARAEEAEQQAHAGQAGGDKLAGSHSDGTAEVREEQRSAR